MTVSVTSIVVTLAMIAVGLLVCVLLCKNREQRAAAASAFFALLVIWLMFVLLVDMYQQFIVAPYFAVASIFIPIVLYYVLMQIAGTKAPVREHESARAEGRKKAGKPAELPPTQQKSATPEVAASRTGSATVAPLYPEKPADISFSEWRKRTPALSSEDTAADDEAKKITAEFPVVTADDLKPTAAVQDGTPELSVAPEPADVFVAEADSHIEPVTVIEPAFHAEEELETSTREETTFEPELYPEQERAAEPVLYEEPEIPVEPAFYEEPAMPVEPAFYEEPEIPVEPVVYEEPEMPAEPVLSIEQDLLAEPIFSAEKETVLEPVFQAEQASPAEPATFTEQELPAETLVSQASTETVAASEEFRRYYRKAEAMTEKKLWLISAKLFEESSAIAVEPDDRTKALFAAMSSFIKAKKPDEAKRLASMIQALPDLSPANTIKLQAVTRILS